MSAEHVLRWLNVILFIKLFDSQIPMKKFSVISIFAKKRLSFDKKAVASPVIRDVPKHFTSMLQ